MLTCRMRLAYVGTPFTGWQRQRQNDTIQGRLEDALRTVIGEAVNVVGAGRAIIAQCFEQQGLWIDVEAYSLTVQFKCDRHVAG